MSKVSNLACKGKNNNNKSEAWEIILEKRSGNSSMDPSVTQTKFRAWDVVLRKATLRYVRHRRVWTHLRNNSPIYAESCGHTVPGVRKGLRRAQCWGWSSYWPGTKRRVTLIMAQEHLLHIEMWPGKEALWKICYSTALRVPSIQAGEGGNFNI